MARRKKPLAWEFDHALKAPLEEWLLLASRLQEVDQALSLAIALTAKGKRSGKEIHMPQADIVQYRMLSCFAAVTYMRCFASGRRRRLKISDVSKLTAADLVTHETVRELRNEHFAHAVGDHEGTMILIVNPKTPSQAGFSVFTVSLASGGSAHLRSFLRLVRKVLKYVRLQEETVGNLLAEAIFGKGERWASRVKMGIAASASDA